jgi:glycosyltransferase involved in cell wall biosynthesis
MKPPDALVPSGDREMAGLIASTLVLAGYEVEIASVFRSYEGEGNPGRQEMLRIGAEQEAARLIERYCERPAEERPQVWFSYHVYYKSPDWIGPLVSRALGIPYVLAEASYAASRAKGPWAIGHLGAEAAIRSANLIFSMTKIDYAGVQKILTGRQIHRRLPPFIDPAPFAVMPHNERAPGEPVRLLAVGMMRYGDKLESYRRLAQYLTLTKRKDWTLTVIGDGPARKEVEEALAPLGDQRVQLKGAHPKFEMPKLYAEADIYIWPAANEAYGVALLEAQAAGLPVVAGKVRGVPDVMLDGQTGFLTPENDGEAFAGVVDFLISDADARRKMGETGRRFVTSMRTMEKASVILKHGLLAVVRNKPPRFAWRRRK